MGVSEADYRKQYATELSALTAPELPPNIHLLTLESWSNDKLLLRLEHFYQKGEDATLSQPTSLNLKNLFSGFEVVAAQELTLSANSDVSALKQRFRFNYTPIGKVEDPMEIPLTANLDITLAPMQIRTFALTIKRA